MWKMKGRNSSFVYIVNKIHMTSFDQVCQKIPQKSADLKTVVYSV